MAPARTPVTRAGAEQATRRGTFPNGMEYLTWGHGPRTMLFIPGGPGSAVPTGLMLRRCRKMFAPYVDAGFAVWVVTRRRHMPAGHTIADMADDHARAIVDGLGGRADLVVGESYGGMIAQYLAAFHPARFQHLAIVVAGCEVSQWGKDVDSRLADALARGDRTAAGTAVTEYLLPGDRLRWLRKALGFLFGRTVLPGKDYPTEDVLTEIRAEVAFDSRGVLPGIQAHVLMICGDRDRFFPRDVVQETADLIPDCTLVWYAGKGHVGTASSGRVTRDVLAFVDQEQPGPRPGHGD